MLKDVYNREAVEDLVVVSLRFFSFPQIKQFLGFYFF